MLVERQYRSPPWQRTVLDSDKFYDTVASDYFRWARSRAKYLEGVDGIVSEHAPPSPRMLDVGAGDGVRAARLAERLHASELTLIDSSEEMLSRCHQVPGAHVVPGDIADPALALSERFELVTCLGNVLAHVGDERRRDAALVNLVRMMAPGARLILDVHNRWNLRAYGWRALRNIGFGSGARHGDFTLVPSFTEPVTTPVHLFAPGELDRRLRAHGLQILGRFAVDYDTGTRRRTALEGQLVYLVGTHDWPSHQPLGRAIGASDRDRGARARTDSNQRLPGR